MENFVSLAGGQQKGTRHQNEVEEEEQHGETIFVVSSPSSGSFKTLAINFQ